MRWLRSPRGLRRDERGVAALEFALVLPVLVLILLGAIDFGRFAFAAITVTNAVRTGAAVCAYGSCSGLTVGDIRQVVQNEAQPYLEIASADIDVDKNVTSGPGCTSSRPCLRVRVTYLFITLIPWPGIPTAITIGRSAQVVTEIQ